MRASVDLQSLKVPGPGLSVAGYFRVSVAREEMRAPELYADEIERFCRYKKLNLKEVFSDLDHSGFRGAKRRPALEELKRRRLEFSMVIVPKLSRFGRSIKELVELFDLFDRDGVSRFHQSVRKEFLVDKTFPSLESAQAALDAWVNDYNTNRPHQALEMEVPAHRFRLVPATKDPSSVPVYSEEDQKGQWVLRRVGSNGVMSVDNQMFSVGNAYKGQLVDAFVDDTTIQVWHQNHLIKTVARMRKGPVRKVRADALHVNHQAEPKSRRSAGA